MTVKKESEQEWHLGERKNKFCLTFSVKEKENKFWFESAVWTTAIKTWFAMREEISLLALLITLF